MRIATQTRSLKKKNLVFHAKLRIGRSVSSKERQERVNKVLNKFNLETCKNVKISIPGRIKWWAKKKTSTD